ncbi:UNKNOWN [Stylonychia lemnae]|uniref:Homeobox domain-containing protein n=1 Tax=Stylonychia lemnae TaxID=5949 RepID=A0A078ARN4_STYLE|nr:UNKNOWN [Stylonychia lemnae]|eukprot:CDW85140.1 UNKNOWN [Stylonychia lemnae]
MNPEMFLKSYDSQQQETKLSFSGLFSVDQDLNVNTTNAQSELIKDKSMILNLRSDANSLFDSDEAYCQLYEQYHDQLFENLWSQSKLSSNLFQQDLISESILISDLSDFTVDSQDKTYNEYQSQAFDARRYNKQNNQSKQIIDDKSVAHEERQQKQYSKERETKISQEKTISGKTSAKKTSRKSDSIKRYEQRSAIKKPYKESKRSFLTHPPNVEHFASKELQKLKQQRDRARFQKRECQWEILLGEFGKDPNWSTKRIKQIAYRTQLSVTQVYKWRWDQRLIQDQNYEREIAIKLKRHGKLFEIEIDHSKSN